MTLPSFHDDYLIGYAVDCETRQISMRVRSCLDKNVVHKVVFSGVEGYHFENDALANIIFELLQISLEEFVATYGLELSDSFRTSGALGLWVTNLETAPHALKAREISSFVLSSSIGMSGWVLAKAAEVQFEVSIA